MHKRGAPDDDTRSLADRLFAAETQRAKPNPDKFMRRTICRFWKEGTCQKGEGKCTWAHGEHEIGTLVESHQVEEDKPAAPQVGRNRQLTPQETALYAKLDAAARERDRIAGMEAAGNLAGALEEKTLSAAFVQSQENAPLDVQAYKKRKMIEETTSTLAQQLLEIEAERGTPADIVRLQAETMASGSFGFGVGPLGEMDLTKEYSSPFIGKGNNRQPKQPLISTNRVYMGIVKAWYSTQKHGRIECEEIRTATGCDVYVYQDVLTRGQAGVGDVVCFSVFASPRGQLQASSPLVRTATHLGYALTGIFRTGGPCDHRTDAGTIDCQELRRVFGIEARVSKEMGRGLIFGRRVAFNAYMNNQGKVYVVSVMEVDEGFQPTPGNLSVTYSMPGFQPADGPGSIPVVANNPAMAPKPSMVPMMQMGTMGMGLAMGNSGAPPMMAASASSGLGVFQLHGFGHRIV